MRTGWSKLTAAKGLQTPVCDGILLASAQNTVVPRGDTVVPLTMQVKGGLPRYEEQVGKGLVEERLGMEEIPLPEGLCEAKEVGVT